MKLDKNLRKAVLRISDYFNERSIPFVIVGALVPTVLIDLRSGYTAYGSRVTRDVDCVIEVDSWDEYQSVKAEMIENGFEERKGSPEHRLFLGDTPVDVIPFGQKLIEDGMLIWPGSDFRMNIRGFENLFRMKEYVTIEKDRKVPFTPLPLVAFLKVMAYSDRRDTKDLEDLFYILTNYESVELSEKRFDVAEKKGLNYDTAGAFLLGRELHKQIPEDIQKDMDPFFKMFSDPESTPVLKAVRLVRLLPAEITDLISAFKRGLSDHG